MSDRYILGGPTGQEPIKCDDLEQWGNWFETAERHVAETTIGRYWVSTVFLGVDHSYRLPDDPPGPPLLFETMTFHQGGNEVEDDDGFGRWSTWEEAEAGHARAVELAQARFDGEIEQIATLAMKERSDGRSEQ